MLFRSVDGSLNLPDSGCRISSYRKRVCGFTAVQSIGLQKLQEAKKKKLKKKWEHCSSHTGHSMRY